MRTIKLSPPNSIIFINDATGGRVPEIGPQGALWWTSSCIAVGTRMELDGPTRITLGRRAVVAPARAPNLEMRLATPSGRVVVALSDTRAVLSEFVRGQTALLSVWINDPREPDEIVIGVE
jgi:hypothetical protein